jgi:tetratricopeptide (TPR) repeat protein
MSPGQARGDPAEIDERSDVYSLGVILYELLTDRPPYELSGLMPEAVRTICETPPRRPSSINRALRGDLETIVLKALEKEPRRRYQSVADFAGDVQRHMHGEPIRARAPGRLYVVRKKLGKHRQFCTAALTVLGFALVSTWSGIRWSRHAAEQQQFRAREDLVRIQDELERGATASAKPKAEVVFAGYPQIPEAILVWAQASYRLADFKARSSAVGWLRQELQQDEGRWDCAALLAEIYREIGDPNSAIGLERQVEGQAPDTAEAWYVRSFATLEKEKALQCARNAANRAPRWVLPWQRLARLCLLTENLDDALPSAATVLAIGGDFFEWTRFRGAVFAKQRRWADAIAEYDKLVHGGERRAMAFLERGHVYRRWGRCLEAVADYTTALDLKVNAREFAIWERYHRATALWILGRRKDAADDCRAMRVDLGRPFYCDARLYLILRDEDQSARAEDVLRRALSEVDDGEPWLRKVFACLGNRLAPDDLIQDALDRENRQQLCEAYYYAGEVYRLAGQLDRARECFAGCVATGVEYDLEKFPDPMNEYDLAHWRLDQLGNKGDPSRVPDSEPVLRGTGDPPVTRTGKMPVPPM